MRHPRSPSVLNAVICAIARAWVVVTLGSAFVWGVALIIVAGVR